jgi:hypothetical protein
MTLEFMAFALLLLTAACVISPYGETPADRGDHP